MTSSKAEADDRETVQPATYLRDRKRELTRTLLVDAARGLFAERGYVQTRIEDISAAAGTSRATFYVHFSEKSDLARALFVEAREQAVERYEALDRVLAERPGDPRKALRDWLAEWLDVWRENSTVYLGMAQAAAVDPRVSEAQLEMGPTLIDALRHAPWNRSTGVDEQARQRALMLEAMTQRIFELMSAENLETPDDVALDFLADLWADVFGVAWWSQDD